ncbi:cysteine--tRNA ligase [Haladaptatus sp. GCM10025707]|uniref:cysteine--tRNA ligase n=1 Tax=unclassified Haladaptatus TaxID=2622732 RepID=UPI0023E8AD6C|nr:MULTISPECIES: cysteine--tRNA ligase [unclassified Haladaptatus]
MTLHVTNTLTGEREAFTPQNPDSVLLYYCGLTVSDFAHLGHARSWVHVDVMHRWLSHLGYDVHHVENFTDVNEKIVARIGDDDLGDDEAAVARHFIQQTLADMRSLNLKRAEIYPRVSEHIPEIVALIEKLAEKGYAYESNGSVYFDVTKFPDYGKLSNQSIEELESQGDPDERSDKRNPADFALWKAGEAHPDDAPAGGDVWESPWGEGRPGWHIECSAMSMTHLGETIDIHVGGQDLVFPHHENEVAQSEAATGKPFARYWLHVRLLETEGEKMSTSLGNFSTAKDLVEEFGADVVRMFLMSAAYNRKQLFNDATFDEAKKRWETLSRGYERAVEACDSVDASGKAEDADLRTAVAETRESFTDAMNDDFNTREALAALLELVSAVNRHTDEAETYDYRGLTEAVDLFEELGGDVLGFTFGGEPESDVSLAGDVVDLVLRVREQEREAGNYERADELRDELEALGVTIEDSDDGPTYRF